jgi:starch phosphorylase
VNTCNVLTLWSARAVKSFALEAFNTGDYYKAVEDEVNSETVTKVLYPNDEPEAGKRLRLLQQYFFVSCSLQHVLHIMDDLADASVRDLPDRFALQLNDTHPSIGVAELMRILVDERQLDWDEAWAITEASFGYTNHTLLPEALETWPLAMFGESLPRHLEIIYEINRRFLDEVRAKFPGDEDRPRRMSLIGEDGGHDAGRPERASQHCNSAAACVRAQSCDGHDTSTKTWVFCLSCSVAESSRVGWTSVAEQSFSGTWTRPLTCTL